MTVLFYMSKNPCLKAIYGRKGGEHNYYLLCTYILIYAIFSQIIMLHFTAPEEIALLEPLGVSHNAIEKLEVQDEEVLVIGCGPVGLLAQAVAKALGAKR